MRASRLVAAVVLTAGVAVLAAGCDTNYYGDSGRPRSTTTTTTTANPPTPMAPGGSTTTTEQTQTYRPNY